MGEQVGDFRVRIEDGQVRVILEGDLDEWEFDLSPLEAEFLASELTEMANLAYQDSR